VIQRLESSGRTLPFIVITGQGDERVAVEMMKGGASDYVVKDKEFLEVLPPLVERVLAQLRIEQRLAAAEQQIRLIQAAVEQAQDAILITSAEKPHPRIVYANPAFCRLTEHRWEELSGKGLDHLEPSATVCFRRALANSQALSGENKLQAGGGEVRTLECHVTPIKDDGGEITHWVSIQRDVTERKTAEKAIDARVRQQAAVASLGTRVLSGARLENILQEACHLLVETLDANFSKVMELLPDGGSLLLRAGAGWRPGKVGQTRVPSAGTPGGLALSSHSPVIYEDISSDERLQAPGFFEEHGVISGMSVPIYDRDKPFGIVGVETRQRRRFTGDDIHFLQAIANAISEALERRRSEKELIEASSREQQRIGQDLHDGLGQHLAGIELLSHVLAEELADEKLPQAEQAQKIAARVREAISHTRLLAHGLSPVNVETDGLMVALRELAINVSDTFKIQCEFRCPQPVLIHANDTATHLYRIAQEATHNAIKHGHAKKVSISLRKKNGEALLRITDNGSGFSGKSGKSGIGLRIMNRRANLIGGRIEIRPGGDEGVEVVCSFPLTPEISHG